MADAELIAIPHEVVDLFAEFTENVEIQTFSHVDTITAKIEAYKPKVVWEGSAKPVEIHDLQLAEGQVSFGLVSIRIGSRGCAVLNSLTRRIRPL